MRSRMRFRMVSSPSRRVNRLRAQKISVAAPAGTAKPLFDRFAVRQPGNRMKRSFWERCAKSASRPQALEVTHHVWKFRQVNEAICQMQAITDADIRSAKSRAQEIGLIEQPRLEYLHRFF